MKKHIHLVIDTNILRANPPDREDYKALQRLVEKDAVVFYLHYIIKEEYRTQLESEFLESLNNIEANLKRLNKYNNDKINDMLNNIDILKYNIDNQINDYMQEIFDNKLQARYLDIQPNDADMVFERYFAGFTPFKKQKDRENIPDAFIFVSLLKMVNENKNVVFITNDKNFIESVKNINDNNSNKIDTFKGIDEFLKTKEIEEILITKDSQEKIAEIIKLSKKDNRIEHFLKNYTFDKLLFHRIEDENLPTDDNSATIESIGYVDYNTIKPYFQQIIHYGNDTIGIYIECQIEATIELLVFKSDAYGLMDEWKTASFNERNKYYFEVERDALLEINAILIVNLNDDIDINFIDVEINNVKFIQFIDT